MPPSAGKIPIKVPIMAERKILHFKGNISLILGKRSEKSVSIISDLSHVSANLKTSVAAKRPIITGIKFIPLSR
ncbi:hypothetical protein ES708_34073 [subsurface metagenome]